MLMQLKYVIKRAENTGGGINVLFVVQYVVPLCNPSQISYCLEHFSLYFGNRKSNIAVSLHAELL